MHADDTEIGFRSSVRARNIEQVVRFARLGTTGLPGVGIGCRPGRPLTHAFLLRFEQVSNLSGRLLGRNGSLACGPGLRRYRLSCA